MEYKVIVAHPERQHSFRLASALKKNGILFKYITTVYNKKSSILMRVTKLFLSQENLQRANNRINKDLEEDDVVQYCELRGLLQIALYRFDKSKRLYNWWHKNTSRRFGLKVAKLAIQEKVDAVILYDANALTCFKYLKTKAPHIKRIMDTSAANRLYMKTIYEHDIKKCPEFAPRLKRERNFLWSGNYCNLLEQELGATQFFLAPSEFVKKSLKYSGIEDNQIFLCPYGTNFEARELDNDDSLSSDEVLKAVYVGNVTEMKGIYYLLEAMQMIPKEKVQLTVVGAFENDDHLFDKYLDRVNFTGRVTHETVRNILNCSDVFVFPSLGEGMSLAVLEAMSCGLPCIISENSGVSEVIIKGENGFVVNVQDIDAIRDKLFWFSENKDSIPAMRKAAIVAANKYSWRTYDKNVTEIVRYLIENN